MNLISVNKENLGWLIYRQGGGMGNFKKWGEDPSNGGWYPITDDVIFQIPCLSIKTWSPLKNPPERQSKRWFITCFLRVKLLSYIKYNIRNANFQIFASNDHQLVVGMRYSAKKYVFLNIGNDIIYISWVWYFTECYDFVEE